MCHWERNFIQNACMSTDEKGREMKVIGPGNFLSHNLFTTEKYLHFSKLKWAPSSFHQCFVGSSTYPIFRGTGLWVWILPQLCLLVFSIQQYTQVKFVKHSWNNDTQVMYFDSQEMCMSYCTGLLKRLALSHVQLCSSQPLLLPLSYCGAWRQGRVCHLLECLDVLHLYIANLCKIQHKCTNIELRLQSELSFLQERAFHLTVSVVIWDEVHWEGELLQKVQLLLWACCYLK